MIAATRAVNNEDFFGNKIEDTNECIKETFQNLAQCHIKTQLNEAVYQRTRNPYADKKPKKGKIL